MSVDQLPTSAISNNSEVKLENGDNSAQQIKPAQSNLDQIDPSHTELIQNTANSGEDNDQVNIEEELQVYQNYLKEYQNYYTSVNQQTRQVGQQLNEDEKFRDSKEFVQILQDPTVPIQVALNRFKKQIIFEGENNLEGLLMSYLNQSPNCSELILTWEVCKTTSEATDLDNELVDLFSLILNNIHSSPNHHLGIKIYKEILEKFGKLLQVYLTNNFPKLNKSVFDLLTNINKFGYSATREVFNTFNLTTKEVMSHAIPSKNSASKPEYRNRLLQLRKSYINFCLSFFKFGDQDIKLKVLELKDFLIQIFKGLEYDSVQYLKEIFSIFFIEVGVNPYLKRITKFRFFNRFLIQQVTNLFSKTQLFTLTETEKTSPAQLAYEFLRDVCSKPGIGICFHDFGYYHPSTFKPDFPKNDPKMNVLNGALLDLLFNLRPVTQPFEQKLSLDILKACPELINYNWLRKEVNLDPKLTSSWLGSITWLQKVINLPLSKWEGYGRTLIKTDLTPSTQVLVNNILPTYFTSKIQQKGLNSDSALIRYTTLNALVTILRKFNTVLDSIDERIVKLKTEGRKTHNWEDLRREVSIEVRKRLIQPQPIMQLYFKLQSPKVKETISEAQLWLMNQTLLRILRYLYYLIPESLLVDKWQLHKNFPSNFYNLPASNQSLFISLLKYYPNFIWWRHPNKKGEEFSPLVQLLHVQFGSNNARLRQQSEFLTKKFLEDSILFDHNKEEILVFLNCLKTLINPKLELTDNSNILKVIELGLNQGMTYRFKYLDLLNQKLNEFNSSNGIESNEGASLPFSPLLLAMEFWYFDLLPNLENSSAKFELKQNYIRFATSMVSQLANLTDNLDFIKYYYSEWKSKILGTLNSDEDNELINYWLTGAEQFINSRNTENLMGEINWQTFDGRSLSQLESSELVELVKSNPQNIREASLIDQFPILLNETFNSNNSEMEQSLINLIALRYPYSGTLFTLKNIDYWLQITQNDNQQFVNNLLELVQLLPFNLTLTISSPEVLNNVEFLDIIQQAITTLDSQDKKLATLIINELSSLVVINFSSLSLLTLRNLIQLINLILVKFNSDDIKFNLLNNQGLKGLFFDSIWCTRDTQTLTLVNSYLIELLNSTQSQTNLEVKELLSYYSDRIKLTILNWLEDSNEINQSAVLLTSKCLELLEARELELISKHLLKKHSTLVKLPKELHHTLVDLISRTLNSDLFDKLERRNQLAKVLEDYLTRISASEDSSSVNLDDFFKLKLVSKLVGYSGDQKGQIQLNLLKTNTYLNKLRLPSKLIEQVISTLYSSEAKLNKYRLKLISILITISPKYFSLVNNLISNNLESFVKDVQDYQSGDIVNLLELLQNWINYYSIYSKLANSSTVNEWNFIGVSLIHSTLVKVKDLDANSIETKFSKLFDNINKFTNKLNLMDYTAPNGLDLQQFYATNKKATNPRVLYSLNLLFSEDPDLKLNTIDTLTSYFTNTTTDLTNSNDITSVMQDTLSLLQSLSTFIKFNELESKTLSLINILLPSVINQIPSQLSNLLIVLIELVGKDQLTLKNQLDFILQKLLPKNLDNWQLNWKSELVECLRTVYNRYKLNNTQIWDTSILDQIRLMFGGTSSNEDVFLLQLMSEYELIQDISLQLDNILIAQSVLKYPKWEINAMLNAGSLVEVSMAQLATYKVANLVKYFDPNLPLQDFNYIPNYYQRDEVYDLRFILPLIGSWFYLKKQVNLGEFIQKNLLGVLIISTTSKVNQVRQVGYQLLDEFISLVNKATPKTLREKSQVLRLLESLAVLVKERKEDAAPPRLPSGVCQFASQALLVIQKPDHPIFLKLSKFLMSPYPFTYQILPMMETLQENFNQREEGLQILNWYLTWLPQSFRQDSDFRLIKNSNLLPSLISFSFSSRSSPQIKRKLLSLVFELTKVPNILSNLLIEEGVLNYLMVNLTNFTFKLNELGANTQLVLLDLIGNYNTLYNLLLSTKLNLLLINNNSMVLTQLLNQIGQTFIQLSKVSISTNNYWEVMNLSLIITKLKSLILNLIEYSTLNADNFSEFELIKSQLTLSQLSVKAVLGNLVEFTNSNFEHLPKVNNRFKGIVTELSFDYKATECWELVHYLHNDYELMLKFVDFSWSKMN